jgi:hypothetical protein
MIPDKAPALDTTSCPLCGALNQCVMAAGKAGPGDPPCWCTKARIDRALLAQIPTAALNKACLCPACAASLPPSELPG